uniref:Uncharacterized protein n=1 Tax=Phakopsora pachyrhizi TaxID=170000 RepID=A0A0S1MJY4_PHAPC
MDMETQSEAWFLEKLANLTTGLSLYLTMNFVSELVTMIISPRSTASTYMMLWAALGIYQVTTTGQAISNVLGIPCLIQWENIQGPTVQFTPGIKDRNQFHRLDPQGRYIVAIAALSQEHIIQGKAGQDQRNHILILILIKNLFTCFEKQLTSSIPGLSLQPQYTYLLYHYFEHKFYCLVL